MRHIVWGIFAVITLAGLIVYQAELSRLKRTQIQRSGNDEIQTKDKNDNQYSRRGY